MSKVNSIEYWVWASGFYLSENIPYDLIDTFNPDYDEDKLNEFIAMHKSADFEDWDVDMLWDQIEAVAWTACKTFDFKDTRGLRS